MKERTSNDLGGIKMNRLINLNYKKPTQSLFNIVVGLMMTFLIFFTCLHYYYLVKISDDLEFVVKEYNKIHVYQDSINKQLRKGIEILENE